MVSITARTPTWPWKTHGTRKDTAKVIFQKLEMQLSCHDADCRKDAGEGDEQRGHISLKYPTPELGKMAREILTGEVNLSDTVTTAADIVLGTGQLTRSAPASDLLTANDVLMADAEVDECEGGVDGHHNALAAGAATEDHDGEMKDEVDEGRDDHCNIDAAGGATEDRGDEDADHGHHRNVDAVGADTTEGHEDHKDETDEADEDDADDDGRAGFSPRTQPMHAKKCSPLEDDEKEEEEDGDGKDNGNDGGDDGGDSDDSDADDDESDADAERARDMTVVLNRLLGDALEEKILQAHARLETECTNEMAHFLREAVFDPTLQWQFAEYAFEWLTSSRFRYAFDKANGSYILYKFNGALWSCNGASSSLEYKFLAWTRKLLNAISDEWSPKMCDAKSLRAAAKELSKKHNNDDTDASQQRWTKDEVLEILKSDTSVVKRIENGLHALSKGVQKEAYIGRLRTAMERVLKTAERYEERGLPTPEKFFDSMDERDYLIGFDNGVYDLEEGRFYPKGSVPVDFLVTMSVKYDYADLDSRLQAQMKDIEEMVYRRIFPDEATRKQMQAVTGSLLSSGNPMKKLILMLGEGDNGKSAFVTGLLKETLGDYFGTLAIQVLTERKDGADGCNPALSANRKRRCLALNEGDKRMKLNSGTTKTLTGNDEVQFRNLYKQPVGARFHAMLLYLSNDAPEIESGEAIGRRPYPIDCISTFKKGLPEDDFEKRVFRALPDTEFKRKCKEWRLAHMHMAIKWWQDLHSNEYILPAPPSESLAVGLLQEASHDGLFKLWLFDHYEKIETAPTDANEALQVKDIRSAYNNQVARQNVKCATDRECTTALKKAGWSWDGPGLGVVTSGLEVVGP
ncbi:hypothetical protein CYMTET_49613 [Cymbomonas tetramitiformis]|uniref:SF3 helicase domain-containing protein n=1 Tax=Cymbomonas tetramitiformis TaxID=36881 RepID=A0AAE0BPT4_9CHLO|nr:hypothetical protein CYMTET_49613 [Cymbomonas tetramitiformis]